MFHWNPFLKFIYSEKATKFCKISSLLLTGTTLDKSNVEISKLFVAFSDYMNCITDNDSITFFYFFFIIIIKLVRGYLLNTWRTEYLHSFNWNIFLILLCCTLFIPADAYCILVGNQSLGPSVMLWFSKTFGFQNVIC